MKNEPILVSCVVLLLGLGFIILRSIAPFVFPTYFVYLIIGIISFLIFSHIDYEVLSAFSLFLYIGSIIFLILPIFVGQVTRGAVRWIPIGALTIQPAEIVRPFLFIFFASFVSQRSPLNIKNFLLSCLLFAIPFLLIVFQPSLGVAILTSFGFLGIILSSGLQKRFLLIGLILAITFAPFLWTFLAPYQKTRVLAIVSPQSDPNGAGYNSIQSKISVGAGEIFGRGLGSGIQTQLSFLPERHTDFIFASISEELGLIGAGLTLITFALLLYRVIKIIENPVSITASVFTSAVFLSFFAQVVVHVGMNMALTPVTGVPLPLVSAGGSSLIATLTTLGIVINTKKS